MGKATTVNTVFRYHGLPPIFLSRKDGQQRQANLSTHYLTEYRCTVIKEDYMKTVRDRACWVWIVSAVLIIGMGMGAASTAVAAAAYPSKSVLMIAPAKPGSGFDGVARAVTQTLTQEKLVTVAMPVQNMASSPIGMQTIVSRYSKDPYMIAVQSTGGMLNYAIGRSPYSHKDWKPIARLMSAYYGVLVRPDSPYKTLGDLIKDLKEKPESTPITGGGDDDRLCMGALFGKAGVDITKINYVVYSGGLESTLVILEGTGKAVISTIDDIMGMIEAKQLRLLAVSPGQRFQDPLLKDIPTFRESGVDLEWGNFRYILGGKDMPDYAVKYWKSTLTKMVKTPTWQEMIKKSAGGNTSWWRAWMNSWIRNRPVSPKWSKSWGWIRKSSFFSAVRLCANGERHPCSRRGCGYNQERGLTWLRAADGQTTG
jgi:putative tricarboxylic transport membrane protein